MMRAEHVISPSASCDGPRSVGKYAVVGAGAVVTHDVAAHAIVVGNPARVVGWACKCGETLSRAEKKPRTAKCTACGRELE
jgi:UDP-2-acetamido-3-amino-2,3-dideoxy-glucuronate N-acetyltransferase